MLQKSKAPSSSLVRIGMANTTAVAPVISVPGSIPTVNTLTHHRH